MNCFKADTITSDLRNALNREDSWLARNCQALSLSACRLLEGQSVFFPRELLLTERLGGHRVASHPSLVINADFSVEIRGNGHPTARADLLLQSAGGNNPNGAVEPIETRIWKVQSESRICQTRSDLRNRPGRQTDRKLCVLRESYFDIKLR